MVRILGYSIRVLGIVFLTTCAMAQGISISGYVKDKMDAYPLVDANVLLMRLPDSSLVEPIVTDLNGKFNFQQVPNGNYVVKVLYVGYQEYKVALVVNGMSIDLKTIQLAPNSLSRDEVIVTVKRSVVQKGDTMQYSADAFKTNPDATAEDLVTKMPGVTMQDGKVQAQGENVTKVLVDGKPFFGDDPASVLKNLQADVIDKIQVFDQLSDQSQFTGFDDGNTSKTINIITKPDKRDGYFGKVYAGYGYDEVYKIGGNVNFFKGDRRITVLGQSNNINEQNFSTEDLAGVSSGSSQNNRAGGSRGGSGGGFGNANSDFLVNTQGGVSQTHALGINYIDKWGKRADVSASYFFNRSDNRAVASLSRRYVLISDSAQTYQEANDANGVNTNHRFNARVDYKIDSSHSILIVPKLSLQLNKGDRVLNGFTDRSTQLLNSTLNQQGSSLLALNFSNMLMYRHKFLKKGRTFSLSLTTGWTKNSGNGYLLARNTYYTVLSTSDTLDQSSDLIKDGYTVVPKVTYTEPLSEKSILEFSYGLSYALNESDKRTYNFDNRTQAYSEQDTTLSNAFKNTYITHEAGTGYRFQTEKYQFSVNGAYQYAELDNQQLFPSDALLKRSFNSFLPSARLRINIGKTKNLRINYRTRTSAPSIDQLQNVINNSNPLQVSVGNPALNQQYQHSFFTRYSNTNTITSSTLFVLLGATYTTDYIVNSTYIAGQDTVVQGVSLSKGAQLISKENRDGHFTARSLLTYGFPVAYIKSNLNLNLFANYTRTPGLINGIVNYANAPSLGGGITISSNVSQYVDFTVSTNSSYNFIRNSVNEKSNGDFFNQNSKAKINLILAKHFVLNTEAVHQYNSGLSAGYNQNYILWNAGLGYKFLKDHAGEFRLTVFDILRQNTSVSRLVTDVYNEDMSSNVLTQYVMLTFTYNFRAYTPKKTESLE